MLMIGPVYARVCVGARARVYRLCSLSKKKQQAKAKRG